jgi:uncharacterized membrane protein
MALQMQRSAISAAKPTLAPRRLAVRTCASSNKGEEQTVVRKMAVPVAATVAASLLLGAQMVAPEEAMAARSGGRAGASSFSARRAAPSRAAATRAGPQVNNYSTTIVAAPPVYSPFGFGGFGYGGFSFMPVVPIPFFGGILQFMFLMLIVSFVFNVIKGAIGAASGANSNKSKSQDWDDL